MCSLKCVVLVVSDTTILNKNSFQNVGHWLELARHVAASNVVIVLVGNKCDQPRAVPRAQAEVPLQVTPFT